MAITAAPTINTSLPPGMMNPGTMGNLPGFNLPSISTPQVDPNQIQTSPNQVYSFLSQSAPQSLTSLIGPLLSQVFGSQNNLMAPIFQQMGQTGAASAQSDAMARGLTGSSIEESGIQQAYTGANQAYSQYLAGQLNQLVPQYTGAAQFDIGNQQNYYSNLAQAVGQQLSNQIMQSQFAQYMDTLLKQSSMTSNASMIGGIAQGVGSAIGAFSDVRLKEDLTPIGKWHGMTMYAFRYRKHPRIKPYDLPSGLRVGFLAHEVMRTKPEVVRLDRGFLRVDYAKLFGLKVRRWYLA